MKEDVVRRWYDGSLWSVLSARRKQSYSPHKPNCKRRWENDVVRQKRIDEGREKVMNRQKYKSVWHHIRSLRTGMSKGKWRCTSSLYCTPPLELITPVTLPWDSCSFTSVEAQSPSADEEMCGSAPAIYWIPLHKRDYPKTMLKHNQIVTSDIRLGTTRSGRKRKSTETKGEISFSQGQKENSGI